MSLIPEECVEYDEARPICIASENNKIFRLINKSGFKIRKVKVDRCLSQKAGERRCDYLMSLTERQNQRVIFIELKGGALNDAVEQILSTIIFLKKEFINRRIDARIVGSRDVP